MNAPARLDGRPEAAEALKAIPYWNRRSARKSDFSTGASAPCAPQQRAERAHRTSADECRRTRQIGTYAPYCSAARNASYATASTAAQERCSVRLWGEHGKS
jgi:hypothetical protein